VSQGFKAEFFGALAKVEPGHFWFEARNQLIIAMLRRYFPRAATFLEIGCGTGFVLRGIRQAIPRLTIAGSEIFSEGLAYAQKRLPDVGFFQMDARSIPYSSALDVIGAFDVLEHIDEDEAVLRQMHDAVRPGGGIILTVPQHQFLWSVTDEFSHHLRRYSRAEVVEKIERAGFRPVHVTSFVTLLLPIMYLSRLRQDPAKYDPQREFAVHPVVNRLLGIAMRLEVGLVRTGVSLPVGGSLLVVARRA
jgi:SAM-dependent methyltransferase